MAGSKGGWPEAQVISGSGRGAGQLPRGAGVIALLDADAQQFVCLVEKRNGNLSFPKGGREWFRAARAWESVLAAARREWAEETGVPLERLRFLRGAQLDDSKIGSRYLLATCEPSLPESGEPDEACLTWTPPSEDQDDPDPIVRAHWIPVQRVLQRRTRLRGERVSFVQQAVAILRGGGTFFRAAEDEAGAPASACSALLPLSSLRASEKHVMKLAKKLREIEKIIAHSACGERVEPAQELKAASREETLVDFVQLLAALPATSDVRAKVADLVALPTLLDTHSTSSGCHDVSALNESLFHYTSVEGAGVETHVEAGTTSSKSKRA